MNYLTHGVRTRNSRLKLLVKVHSDGLFLGKSRKGTLMSDTLVRSCLFPKKMTLVLLGFISNWCEQHHPAMRRRSPVIFTSHEFTFLAVKEQ